MCQLLIFLRQTLTMSCSDVIGTKTLEVSLAVLEVIWITYKNTFFAKEIENIFVEILLPKAKPLIVRIIYRSPSQSNIPEIINANLDKLDTDMRESYILGDLNKI